MTARKYILLYLQFHNTFRTDLVAEKFGLSVQSVRHAATKLHREGVIVLDQRRWRTFTYRRATDAEKKHREPAAGTNVICAECRNSPVMKRILTVYGVRA